jgi:hypothetical protein
MTWVSINDDCRDSLLDLVEVRGHPQYEANLQQYVSCEQTKNNFVLVPLTILSVSTLIGGIAFKNGTLIGMSLFILFFILILYISSSYIENDFHDTGRKIAQRVFDDGDTCITTGENNSDTNDKKNNLCKRYVEFDDEQKVTYIKYRNEAIDQIRENERLAALAARQRADNRRYNNNRYNNRYNSRYNNRYNNGYNNGYNTRSSSSININL